MNKSDGLKKIYLIKSADYQFAEIDLSDNTLLLGESGVGKTTLMRAILFFYTMDYSDGILNINPDTKKSFNQWYFQEPNSHIVYEYTKGDNRFLFIVSNGGHLHYTFIDITTFNMDVKELFLEGNRPLNLQELHENIQINNLSNYSTSKKERYINCFHKKDADNRKIKQDSETDFTLFEDIASRKEFAKTLSNIFTSSKVHSDALKKTIVSLIEDSNATINLKKIKDDLNDYVLNKKEIESFEKKIPTIKKLATTLSYYNSSKIEFKKRANQIERLKTQLAIKMEELSLKLTSLSKESEELAQHFIIKKEIVDEKIAKKLEEITITSNDITNLQRKELEYKEQNIEALVEEYKSEESYKNAKQNLSIKYKALTSNVDNINAEFNKILQKLEKEKEYSIFNLKTSHNAQEKKINDKNVFIVQNKEQKIVDATQQLKEMKLSLESELQTSLNSFNEIKVQQGKVENFLFNNENIQKYTQDVEKYRDELFKIEPQKIKNQHDIQNIDKDIFAISQTLKNEKDKLSLEINREKEQLQESKKDIEKKLDFNSSNLYGYLNKNRVKNREKIVTYLKDDILFSEREFRAREIENDSAIFGLEINFDEEFSNDYKQIELLDKLEKIKNRLKSLNKKAIVESEKFETIASTQTKAKNRERSTLYALKQELEDNQRSYIKNRDIALLNLENAKTEASKLRDEKSKALNKKYIEQDALIKIVKEKISNVIKEIDFIIASINSETKNEIAQLQEQIVVLQTQERESIQKIDRNYEEETQKIKEELFQQLKEKGIDDTLLKSIIAEIESLKQKLVSIEKNKLFVMVYLSEYKEKIENIEMMQKILDDNRVIFNNFEKELEFLIKENQLKNDVIVQDIAKLKKSKTLFNSFISSYKKEIEEKEIATAIKNAQSLEYIEENSSLFDDEEFISTIVYKIINIFNEIEKHLSDIKLQTKNAINGLTYDNIFKIEIIDDYIILDDALSIKIAKNLVEYIEKDKIKILKETSSEMFKSSLIFIRKELGIFDEAILDIESEVMNLRNRVRKAVESFNVIDSIEIRFQNANSEVLEALKSISTFYSENSDKFLSGLFNEKSENSKIEKELSSKIVDLVTLLITTKEYMNLESGFVLEFKVIEKGNDLKWRQTLNDVGSNGTSTLVKSIINISILQLVSKNIVKENIMVSHCILDEIGTISTDYFKELKDYVNASGFLFVNGMPIEDDILISMYPTVYVGQNCGGYSKMLLASKVVV